MDGQLLSHHTLRCHSNMTIKTRHLFVNRTYQLNIELLLSKHWRKAARIHKEGGFGIDLVLSKRLTLLIPDSL